MTELDALLNLDHKKETIELTKNEKSIIKYLLNLKGKRLVIEKMAKDIGLAKETIYNNLERIQKNKIIKSCWKLDPFVLDFKVIEVEASVDKSKRGPIVKKLSSHPAISSIKKCFQDNLRIDIIVREIEEYKEIQKHLEKWGLKILNFKIIIERLYEP